MSEKTELTLKQKYLEYLLPDLNDSQIDKMIAAVQNAPKSKTLTNDDTDMDAYAELMGMIGCDNAKEQLDAMIADYRMQLVLEARGRSSTRSYYHAVFSGNPGCAKTTVARLYAKVLAKEGIIKTDSFAEIGRCDLVGQYVGSTAAKVRAVFEKYKGGVIFIDEAYSLCDSAPGSNNNYGEEAINEIVFCLDNCPETVVIFAGYPDRMDTFIRENPGMSSRVPYRVAFNDYSTEELIEISKVIAKRKGFELTASALDKLAEVFDSAKTAKDFGNGRYVRNVIEAAVRTKGVLLGITTAQNLDNFKNTALYSDEALFSLDENCIRIQTPTDPAPKKAIGFRV